MNPPDTDLDVSLRNAREALLKERNAAGHWEGELSTSALSTATAIIALHCVSPETYAKPIAGGAQWLVDHQNSDGGWGDTVLSFSNISTSLLCWSALSRIRPEAKETLNKAGAWISDYTGSLSPERIVEKVTARYGKDRTFAVPILMACALGGRLGNETEAWKRVLPLPFELAAFPREWFAALQLPVVSYALPALIAIGYARYYHVPPAPPLSWIRKSVWPKTSALLTQIQPTSGGFLEAAPLTSFVTMALASADQKEHPVVKSGVRFLLDSIRPDGSWPIDTNLATWGTTLATKALLVNDDTSDFGPDDQAPILVWLLGQQYQEVHPFTAAAPGGWAWTDLTGGVPDADDTPGALLALHKLAGELPDRTMIEAAEQGIIWLLNLQNRDGGIPTFCKGWGALPFDRSSQDLTAHTLRAWYVWKDLVSPAVRARMDRALDHALEYLARNQAEDGSWTPLWFGNQHVPDEINRTYGTAKVLLALSEIDDWDPRPEKLRPASMKWLLANQNVDGGWGEAKGSPSSIEETALAVDALASLPFDSLALVKKAIERGVAYLVEATSHGTRFPAAPIGFYFAKLWYFEKLYPVVWTVSALGRAKKALADLNPKT